MYNSFRFILYSEWWHFTSNEALLLHLNIILCEISTLELTFTWQFGNNWLSGLITSLKEAHWGLKSTKQNASINYAYLSQNFTQWNSVCICVGNTWIWLCNWYLVPNCVHLELGELLRSLDWKVSFTIKLPYSIRRHEHIFWWVSMPIKICTCIHSIQDKYCTSNVTILYHYIGTVSFIKTKHWN